MEMKFQHNSNFDTGISKQFDFKHIEYGLKRHYLHQTPLKKSLDLTGL